MMKMNSKEEQVLKQLFSDTMNSGSNGEEKISVDTILSIRDKYAKDVAVVGSVVVNVEMTQKGGTVIIREIVELREEWKGYGEYIDSKCTETNVLVEPPNYRSTDVQPFNRQAPYYLGTNFAFLDSVKVENWNVITDLKEYRSNVGKLMFPTKNMSLYRGDSYLLGTVVLEKNDLKQFIEETLTACKLPVSVIHECLHKIG